MTDTVPGIDLYDDVTYEGWAMEGKYYLWVGKLRRRANENVWGFCTPVVLLPSLHYFSLRGPRSQAFRESITVNACMSTSDFLYCGY